MIDVLPPGFRLLDVGGGRSLLELPCRCRVPVEQPVEPDEINVPILDPSEAERMYREKLVLFAARHVCKK
jgi:hypothetical protein